MFRWLHYIGVAFIFISAILLLVTSISAPVIGDIAILKIMLTNKTDIRNSSLTFGTFGHCALDVPPVTTDQDWCSSRSVGYPIADIIASVDSLSLSSSAMSSYNDLTNVFVLHPVACALALIAGIFAAGGFFGSLFGVLIAIVAWIVTIVVMAVDFAVFGALGSHVNNDGTGNHAYFSIGMWTTLAAFILLFFGTIIVFFTCCTERRKRKRGVVEKRNSRF